MPFNIQWVDHCKGTEEISKMVTPAGKLVLYSRSGVIYKTDWELDDRRLQLDEQCLTWEDYGSTGDSIIFVKLLRQGTPFRNRVWVQLSKIPFGETITYSALALKIGSAARAVGNACRDNPFPLLIPCHRVVSVSGIGGYSGQTEGDFMAIKRKLLAFESTFKQ
ncbi:MAG: methylated-DNA--[protein]-cysteine S-methyltransferase [Methylococcaceae bacterium]|nr:methylated-DNA--[protein]-cysteine S-methyltransferase [Methylococcaceae bacterium]